ncbi:MAG: PhoH family protein [Desulfotomaculum sp.]|nr:PhoH family protein [Desulfotomaculum sp.]
MKPNTEVRIILDDIRLAAEIMGQHDQNIVYIEKLLNVKMVIRGDELIITGTPEAVQEAGQLLNQLLAYSDTGNNITVHEINYALQVVRAGRGDTLADLTRDIVAVNARGKQIKPKTPGQKQYIDAIRKHDVVFCIGPAGTGKTYLSVALAVAALRNKTISRLVLTRPAVEAGEKLGFLPGDLQDKVDPYLRPVYDGLYDVLGVENTQKYMERNIIEIAPLAYMRGRTLDDAFIILDEAQNTTPEQMKMFLTRLGFGSKAIINGDITQIDLSRGQKSGLVDAQMKLSKVPGLAFNYMTGDDIVRHSLVHQIIKAYDLAEQPAQADRK